jgi:glutamyl-tRNA reductase
VTALVGVGDMCRKVAQALSGSTGKCLVVNRTLSRAEEFCENYGGSPTSLADFKAHPPGYLDLVLTATSADEAVITAADLAPALEARRRAGVSRPLIVVDLGLPRDVDSAVDSLPGVLVVAMDQLESLSNERQACLDRETRAAEQVVGTEVERLLREERYASIADESAQQLLFSDLEHLSHKDRHMLERFVTGLAGRMARQPLDLAS